MSNSKKSATGYYCIYDEKSMEIHSLGYSESEVASKRQILLTDISIESELGNKLAAFIASIYFAGINIFSTKKRPFKSITEIAKTNNLENEFETIEVLDILGMTGAVDFDVIPFIPVPSSPQPAPRPSIRNVMNSDPGDSGQLIRMIKYLGLEGLLKKLYKEYALSFDNFKLLFHYFYSLERDRIFAYKEINTFIRGGHRTFSEEQKNELING